MLVAAGAAVDLADRQGARRRPRPGARYAMIAILESAPRR
jgi:hypothetical protein